MEISQIRLINLTKVLNEHFAGEKVRLAEAIGVAPSNISRYYNKNERDRRKIADDTARAIERAVNLHTGWMDVLHTSDEDATLDKIIDILKPMNENRKRAILAFLQSENR